MMTCFCVSVGMGIIENMCVHTVHQQGHLQLSLRLHASDSKEEVPFLRDRWPDRHI